MRTRSDDTMPRRYDEHRPDTTRARERLAAVFNEQHVAFVKFSRTHKVNFVYITKVKSIDLDNREVYLGGRVCHGVYYILLAQPELCQRAEKCLEGKGG